MTAARPMNADLHTARARRARTLAEAYQRRRLRKPAVQVTAFALAVVSVAINCNLLLQGTDYLIDARDLVGRFTLLTLQTSYRQRLFWGLLLPSVLGAGWLVSLLVIGRAYAGYALHRRWWESQTGSTPYSWLSPGSGYLVLVSRFLLVTRHAGRCRPADRAGAATVGALGAHRRRGAMAGGTGVRERRCLRYSGTDTRPPPPGRRGPAPR